MNDRPLKIYLFYCSNSLAPEALRQCCDGQGSDILKTISLPCSGKLELIYLLKAFEGGADAIALVTCKQGECRYLEGNLRAQKRVGAVDSLLEEIGLDSGRLVLIQKKKEEGAEQIVNEIENIRKKIRREYSLESTA